MLTRKNNRVGGASRLIKLSVIDVKLKSCINGTSLHKLARLLSSRTIVSMRHVAYKIVHHTPENLCQHEVHPSRNVVGCGVASRC